MPPKINRPLDKEKEFLPYEMDYIPEDLQERAKSELFEDEETKTHSLRLLRSMLRDEPDLLWQDEDWFLIAFLRARKYDVKRAFQLIKTFYTVKGKRNELYHNYKFEDVVRTMEEGSIGFLPYRDSEGCVILVIRTTHWNPQIYTMADIMRTLTFGLFHAILSPATQIAGFKVIFDAGGITFSHLPHISPTYLWLFAEALQNCFPARFKAIHMVNEVTVFSYIWNILKQFLSKKIRDRFHFHGKNVKKLRKYFPPRLLPAEYAGDGPPFDNTVCAKLIIENADFYRHVLSFGYKKYKTKADEKASCSSHS